MTAHRRILPLKQVRETLDLLRSYGVPVEQCAIDIGPDGVKVSPPANHNSAGDVGSYINRSAHRPKAGEGR